MNLFDVADGPAASFDRIEEVGPQFFDVLVVWLIQFCVFVDHGVFRIRGIESPAVNPAHVKRSIGPVEITADGLLWVRLFGVVARKSAMLPTDRELIEFVNGHLMVWSVGRLRLFCVHDWAGDRTAPG